MFMYIYCTHTALTTEDLRASLIALNGHKAERTALHASICVDSTERDSVTAKTSEKLTLY